MAKNNFEKCLRIGKAKEKATSRYLARLGFSVADISLELMPNGCYSPFDLLISKDEAVFVADVKSRSPTMLWFSSYDMLAWARHDTSATRLIIFALRPRNGFRYITVSDALRVCLLSKDFARTFTVRHSQTIDIRRLSK